ncbi:superoxide dismutase family protein [bacterium]|nr:superoxide dismutase family protein [bacterium]
MIFLLTGCTRQERSPEEAAGFMEEEDIQKAVAVLHPKKGHDVHGTVTFTKMEKGIKVVADIKGLTPGKHGFHIHQLGDCRASDASSAGGHFNPDNTSHGAPTDEERHVGDLGNVTADENGKAHYERIDTYIAFQGAHSIIGRAVVVHAGEDDFTSQPSGAAGPRVACGVIGIAQEKTS